MLFFSRKRRDSRFVPGDGVQACALPILGLFRRSGILSRQMLGCCPSSHCCSPSLARGQTRACRCAHTRAPPPFDRPKTSQSPLSISLPREISFNVETGSFLGGAVVFAARYGCPASPVFARSFFVQVQWLCLIPLARRQDGLFQLWTFSHQVLPKGSEH